MSANITIPSELDNRIAAKARALGISKEQYARDVLERDLAAPTIRELFAPVREEIQGRGITDEELLEQIETAVEEVRQRRRA